MVRLTSVAVVMVTYEAGVLAHRGTSPLSPGCGARLPRTAVPAPLLHHFGVLDLVPARGGGVDDEAAAADEEAAAAVGVAGGGMHCRRRGDGANGGLVD